MAITKKIRKTCKKCKAKKYKKYLTEIEGKKFVCRNADKCLTRGANYKK